jgi:hypothetical protein
MEEKYYLLTFSEDYADEHDVPALACMTEIEYKKWLDQKIEMCAYLGNSGDGFEEEYEEYKTGKDYIKAKLVTKYKVSKEFYDSFHKANLANLSMCSVFVEPEEY